MFVYKLRHENKNKEKKIKTFGVWGMKITMGQVAVTHFCAIEFLGEEEEFSGNISSNHLQASNLIGVPVPVFLFRQQSDHTKQL